MENINVTTKPIKTLKRKLGSKYLWPRVRQNLLYWYDTKSISNNNIVDKLVFIKYKTGCASKDTAKKVKEKQILKKEN